MTPHDPADARLCSGLGQYHTNESDPNKPNKKLTPYNAITLTAIRAMVDSPPSLPKAQGRWLIPSTLPSRNFKAQEESGEFWLLWADIDVGSPPLDDVQSAIELAIDHGRDHEIYSSRSATQSKLKWRILIALASPLSGADFGDCQALLNDALEAIGVMPDRASERHGQLCYLPNRGEHYESASVRAGAYFDPLAAWSVRINAKRKAEADRAAELESERAAAKARRANLSIGDAPDLIGAFNLVYSVQEILLQVGYQQRGDHFRHPNSESGSFSASVKDGRVYSLSPSDPLFTGPGGGAHDAFGAFTVLFHHKGQSAALHDAGDNWLAIEGESWNQARKHAKQNARSDARLPVRLDIGTLATTLPTKVDFVIDGWLPAGVATLIASHGGIGKSAIALYLCAILATGLPWCGARPARRVKVLLLSCEDDAHVLHWRLHRICAALDVNLADLADWLVIEDATQADNILYSSNPSQRMTAAYDRLAGLVRQEGIGVTVIDNASDVFGGSEIARAEVREFFNHLRRLGTVVLLAHVNREATRSQGQPGQQYSGSTAWHNSARSRWELVTAPDFSALADADDDDLQVPTIRTLSVVKSNYGPTGAAMQWRWDQLHGVLLPDEPSSLVGSTAARVAEELALLRAVVECSDVFKREVRYVSSGPCTPRAVLSDSTHLPARCRHMKLQKLLSALRSLVKAGYLTVVEQRADKGRKFRHFVPTAAGRDYAAGH